MRRLKFRQVTPALFAPPPPPPPWVTIPCIPSMPVGGTDGSASASAPAHQALQLQFAIDLSAAQLLDFQGRLAHGALPKAWLC